jgi:lambda family phage portal protein
MAPPMKRAGWLGTTGFEAASRTSVELGQYRPAQRSPDAALLESRELVDDRLRDQERNNGLVYTAVDRKIDTVVGADIRPRVLPNWRVLGITQEAARDLGKQIEAHWSVYANDPDKMLDAGRRMNHGLMARVQYWHWLVDGRNATIPLWLPRYGADYGTTFMVIDPRRISNPDGKPDSKMLRGGIELDRYGAPVAYHVRERNPGDIYANGNDFRWERIPAFTRFGRRRFIHGFAQRQAEQTQGRSPLLAVLKKGKMFEKRDDLELQAAAHLASMATYIKSEVPSEALFRMLGDAPTGSEAMPAEMVANFMEFAADYYSRTKYMVNGVTVPHLLPNEEIGTVESQRAGADFVNSQQAWQRYFGWALGMPYEQISGDFSKSAYVGMQAAFNEAHKNVTSDRAMFGDQTLTPQFDLWLEEAIDDGVIQLPAPLTDYASCRKALLDGLAWIGPGRGTVDPLKTANAKRVNLETGIETLEQQLADTNIDAEDHIAQLALEEQMRRDAGLPSIFKNAVPPVDPNAPDAPPEPGYEPAGAPA